MDNVIAWLNLMYLDPALSRESDFGQNKKKTEFGEVKVPTIFCHLYTNYENIAERNIRVPQLLGEKDQC